MPVRLEDSVWMRPLKADSGNFSVQQPVYQIKIVLLGTGPPIWRRVLVPAEFTLARLHNVVQAAMGWEDDHLHEFHIGGLRFGVPDPNDALMGGPSCINEENARLTDVLNKRGPKPKYIYDFGDSWEHALTVEKVLIPESNIAYPLCTGGKRNCPPEDSGGIPGFYNKLEALADPNHAEHEDIREWMGNFDPESFSVEAVNQKFRKIFRGSHKTKPARVAQQRFSMPGPEDVFTLLREIQAGGEKFRKQRQRIRPDEEVPLELSDRERTLILEHTFADEELTKHLRLVPGSGERSVYRFTLDNLDELAAFVAAEANHAKDKKLRKELDHLFERIDNVLESYTDQDD